MRKKQTETIAIQAPDFQEMCLSIEGTAPYVQLRFSQKAKETMLKAQMEGGTKRSKKDRVAKDPESLFDEARYMSTEGWPGIPASAFRNAMIRACSVAGVVMTQAKMLVFVEADGFDAHDQTPLVRLNGTSEPREDAVRNASGVADIRVRAMYWPWSADVRVRFDQSFITRESVINLLHRAGQQVGIGEGRPMSKSSAGMGWGTFRLRAQDT